MPVRKVSNRSRRNTIGKFPSLKMQRMITYESLVELDYIYCLDFEPDVTFFEEQPIKINYEYDGGKRHYTPDFHIVEAGKNVLVECKPKKFVDTEENQRKFDVAQQWCQSRDWQFRVVTEADLRSGYRLNNIKMLTRHARHKVKPEIRAAIFQALAKRPRSIDDLASVINPGDSASMHESILHLIFHNELITDLDEAELSEMSLVHLFIP